MYHSEKEVNERFGRVMNRDISENRELFRKEVGGKINGGKMKRHNRVGLGEDDILKT